MTDKTEAQPEALRLANWIDSDFDPDEMLEIGYDAVAAELRRQHAETEAQADRIASLEAQLSQAQAVPMDSLLSLESSAHEIFNNPPSDTSQDVRDVIEWYAASVRVALAFQTTPPASMLAASPTPPASKGLSDEQIEAAAQKLAICMDYPWQFMPDEGKKRMRFDARCIIEAAHGIQGEGNE